MRSSMLSSRGRIIIGLNGADRTPRQRRHHHQQRRYATSGCSAGARISALRCLLPIHGVTSAIGKPAHAASYEFGARRHVDKT
jgi:hypothetical protein